MDGSKGERWRVGAQYVMAGKGVVTVSEVDRSTVTAKQDEETTFRLSLEQAAQMLRPMVTKEEAEQLLANLCQRLPVVDGRPTGKRSVLYRRTLRSGAFADQVATLAAMYNRPAPEYPEDQHIPRYEELIFPELGLALGKSRRAIKALVRGAVLGERPPESLAAPDRSAELRQHHSLPEVPPYQAIGPIAVERELGVGESGLDLKISVKPGIWYAYQRPRPDEETGSFASDDFDRLVAVHHRHAGELDDLERRSSAVGELLPIDGARMSIMDAAFAEDDEFQTELHYGDQLVQGRAARVFLSGDGAGQARVARSGDLVVLVAVGM